MRKRLFLSKIFTYVLCIVSLVSMPASVSAKGIKDLPTYQYDVLETSCENNGQRIYGLAYVPRTNKQVPMVIFSHELGNTHSSGTRYAESLAAQGIAVYTFDFRGGSVKSQSDGKTTEMSVMTEVSDLESVIKTVKTWNFVDPEKIVLLGGSQGGLVSAVTAARHAEDVAGLILLYPAFVIHDDLHKAFSSLEEVPEQFSFRGWIQVGKNYAKDMWDYNAYAEIGNYQKEVLLLHGDNDSFVDISYSQKATEAYKNAQLYVIHGAGHNFRDDTDHFNDAINHIFTYLQERGLLE